jgi:hypothetical protein
VFQLSDIIRKRAEVTVRDTASGALLIDLATGKCWQLNRIGADFLSQLDTEKALSDVCDVLEGRYDVSGDILRRDLLRLAQELLDGGLIERTGK